MHTFLQFGFRKWKGNVTEKPIEDQSDIIKELYSDLRTVKPQEGNSMLLAFSANRFFFNFYFYVSQGLYSHSVIYFMCSCLDGGYL